MKSWIEKYNITEEQLKFKELIAEKTLNAMTSDYDYASNEACRRFIAFQSSNLYKARGYTGSAHPATLLYRFMDRYNLTFEEAQEQFCKEHLSMLKARNPENYKHRLRVQFCYDTWYENEKRSHLMEWINEEDKEIICTVADMSREELEKRITENINKPTIEIPLCLIGAGKLEYAAGFTHYDFG